jgi:hypothetical protein
VRALEEDEHDLSPEEDEEQDPLEVRERWGGILGGSWENLGRILGGSGG